MNRYPDPSPAFAGRSFADVLDQARTRAFRDVTRLQVIDNGTASRLIANHDVQLPIVDWETPFIDVTATEKDTTRYATAWPVSGPAEALTWRPSNRWITNPAVLVGVAGRNVVAVVEGRRVPEQDMANAVRRARRYIDAHLTALWEQREEWRPPFARQVRAAVLARADLLASVADLKEGIA